MFGDRNIKTLVVALDFDPAADDDIYLFKAPEKLEIISASMALNNALAGSTANYFDVALYNGGTAGTAVTAIAGTIGGTAGWSALTPKDFTVSNGTVTANQVVYLRYNEEGTGTFTAGVVQINYKLGQA
jgi:hypothetical protein